MWSVYGEHHVLTALPVGKQVRGPFVKMVVPCSWLISQPFLTSWAGGRYDERLPASMTLRAARGPRVQRRSQSGCNVCPRTYHSQLWWALSIICFHQYSWATSTNPQAQEARQGVSKVVVSYEIHEHITASFVDFFVAYVLHEDQFLNYNFVSFYILLLICVNFILSYVMFQPQWFCICISSLFYIFIFSPVSIFLLVFFDILCFCIIIHNIQVMQFTNICFIIFRWRIFSFVCITIKWKII